MFLEAPVADVPTASTEIGEATSSSVEASTAITEDSVPIDQEASTVEEFDIEGGEEGDFGGMDSLEDLESDAPGFQVETLIIYQISYNNEGYNGFNRLLTNEQI